MVIGPEPLGEGDPDALGEGLDEELGDELGAELGEELGEEGLPGGGPSAWALGPAERPGRSAEDSADALLPRSPADSPVPPFIHPTAANPATPTTATAPRPLHRGALARDAEAFRRRLRVRLRLRERGALCALIFLQSVISM
jgi:hypothetical protein